MSQDKEFSFRKLFSIGFDPVVSILTYIYSKQPVFNNFEIVYKDEISDTIQYYAFSNPDQSYYIMKCETITNVQVYTYTVVENNITQFETDWTNRAILTYSKFYVLFQ